MKLRTKKSTLLPRLVLVSLLAAVLLFSAVNPVSAGDPADSRGIDSPVFGSDISMEVGYSWIDETILFMQPSVNPATDYYYAWTSHVSAHQSMDDFYGVSGNFNHIFWYGTTLIFDDGWTAGTYEGMLFMITFYTDESGAPGTKVGELTGLVPQVTVLDEVDGYMFLRFDLFRNIPFNLTKGWISIQSTYSPNGSWFLWMNSATGNENGIQDGETMENYANLAFGLAGLNTTPAVGGEVAPVDRSWTIVIWPVLAVLAIGVMFWVIRRRRTA